MLRAALKDAAAVNATRWKLFEVLKQFGLPIETGTGGRTKYNRERLQLPKAHWIDAACVGASTPGNIVFQNDGVLEIKAYFDIKNTAGKRVAQGISYKHCVPIHLLDGYAYKREASPIPPHV